MILAIYAESRYLEKCLSDLRAGAPKPSYLSQKRRAVLLGKTGTKTRKLKRTYLITEKLAAKIA
jgi:hypothetical protein